MINIEQLFYYLPLMKRFLFLSITLFFILSSCYRPSYTFTQNSSNSFGTKKAKYLVNYVQAPEAVRTDFQEQLLERFPENTVLAENANVSIFPTEIPENPETDLIKQITTSTGDFEYLINIKAEISSDNISSIQVGSLDPSSSNETTVALEIFDLENPGTVFYSRVRATLQDRNDIKDFSFTVDTNTMLRKSLKKILKRIDQIN